MRIAGEWRECDDGVSRPAVIAQIVDTNGQGLVEYFLLDGGADRTVFRVEFLQALGLPSDRPTSAALMGVGGVASFVLVSAVMEFTADDGKSAVVRGQFAAFADVRKTDLSILGRDVLDNFDLIVSRQRNEILLLALTHRYDVSPA